jgi:hypothetical protein
MKNLLTSRFHSTLCRCALPIALLLPFAALADTWQIQVGAQNGDRAHQALAFLPNEVEGTILKWISTWNRQSASLRRSGLK